MDAYSTDAWRKARRTYLTRYPHCVDCGAQATEPDHVPPRRLLVALGVHDPDHTRWLRARCASCHATKTRTIDEPLMRRWEQGEDAQILAEGAMKWHDGVGRGA